MAPNAEFPWARFEADRAAAERERVYIESREGALNRNTEAEEERKEAVAEADASQRWAGTGAAIEGAAQVAIAKAERVAASLRGAADVALARLGYYPAQWPAIDSAHLEGTQVDGVIAGDYVAPTVDITRWDGLAPLGGLTQLRELNLTGTDVTGTGLEHLKPLTQLRGLYLAYAPVADAGLEHLKGCRQLRMLDLAFTEVTDAGSEHLKELRELEELGLSYSKFTAEGVRRLRQALPNCTIYWDPKGEPRKGRTD